MNPIAKMKHYNVRLTTILNELEKLEDFEDTDYSEVVTDIGFNLHILENRREQLLKRGRTL